MVCPNYWRPTKRLIAIALLGLTKRCSGYLPAALCFSIWLHVLVIFCPQLGQPSAPGVNKGVEIHKQANFLDARLTSPLQSETPPAETFLEETPATYPEHQGDATTSTAPPLQDTSPTELRLSVGAHYYPAKMLTIKPKALSDAIISAEDPVLLTASGYLILHLWINENGNVIHLFIDYSELSDDLMKRTIDALRKLRFSPGELNGQKVGTLMQIEVSYEAGFIPRILDKE